MLDFTTRNDAKQRRITCGYADRVDGINTAQRPCLSLPLAIARVRLKTPGTLAIFRCTAWSPEVVVANTLGHNRVRFRSAPWKAKCSLGDDVALDFRGAARDSAREA